MIQLFQPSLGDEELEALRGVFASNWLGKGAHVHEFERLFAESLGVPAAEITTTSSCTEGLFLVSELFGIGAGDEVIVPSISFIAVGSAVVAAGATLVLCDVDSRSMNVTAADIEACLTPRTRAVIVTHYGGIPCEMDDILALCRPRNIAVIEDAACAPRSFYRGRAAGTMGDLGTWSLDAMKIVSTGDGGVLYIKDPERMSAAKEQLYLGLPNRQSSGIDNATSGASEWWEFDVNRPGRRAIMNNIAGAIGCVQMRRLPGFLERRSQVAARYRDELTDLAWLRLPPDVPAHVIPTDYFFWIQLELRNALAQHLRAAGIYSTFRYWPLHRVAFFKQGNARLPKSDLAAAITLNLPLHQSLSDDDVAAVIGAVRAFDPGKSS